MASTPLENLKLFLKSTKSIQKDKYFIQIKDNDSLIQDLSYQDTDEPDYNLTMISVNNVIQHYSLIFIGALSGFFPMGFTDEIKDEMIRFLEIAPFISLCDTEEYGNALRNAVNYQLEKDGVLVLDG
jgi:hypothetical protein